MEHITARPQAKAIGFLEFQSSSQQQVRHATWNGNRGNYQSDTQLYQ
jgi:hypothetical protein